MDQGAPKSPSHHRNTQCTAEGSFLAGYFEDVQGKTPEAAAALLAADDRIDAAHGSAAEDGQSAQTGEDVVGVELGAVGDVGVGGWVCVCVCAVVGSGRRRLADCPPEHH